MLIFGILVLRLSGQSIGLVQVWPRLKSQAGCGSGQQVLTMFYTCCGFHVVIHVLCTGLDKQKFSAYNRKYFLTHHL